MTNSNATNSYTRLSAFLNEKFGLSLDGSRRKDIERAVSESCATFNLSESSLIDRVFENPQSKYFSEILDNLKISETYFFRENPSLKLAVELLQKRELNRPIKFWIAGCSTGEEIYSLIITLKEVFNDSLDFTVMASDINNNSINKAKRAEYGNWSFRNADDKILKKYFTKNENLYQVQQEIRDLVSFQYHNLVESPYPSVLNNTDSLDCIFCRNVLIYFGQETRDKIINKFYDCLLPQGLLFLGLTETPLTKNTKFSKVIETDSIYFVKTVKQSSLTRPKPAVTPAVDNNDTKISTKEESTIENETILESVRELYASGEYPKCVELIARREDKHELENLGNPETFEIKTILIYSLLNTDNLELAIDKCLDAISIYKEEPKFYLILANLFVHSEDYNNALINARKVIFIEPENIAANILLAKLLRLKGEKESSIKQFNYVHSLLGKLPKDKIIDDTDGFSVGNLENLITKILEEE